VTPEQRLLARCPVCRERDAALARLAEAERLLALVWLGAPTAIPGVAPHGIVTTATLLKIDAFLSRSEPSEP